MSALIKLLLCIGIASANISYSADLEMEPRAIERRATIPSTVVCTDTVALTIEDGVPVRANTFVINKKLHYITTGAILGASILMLVIDTILNNGHLINNIFVNNSQTCPPFPNVSIYPAQNNVSVYPNISNYPNVSVASHVNIYPNISVYPNVNIYPNISVSNNVQVSGTTATAGPGVVATTLFADIIDPFTRACFTYIKAQLPGMIMEKSVFNPSDYSFRSILRIYNKTKIFCNMFGDSTENMAHHYGSLLWSIACCHGGPSQYLAKNAVTLEQFTPWNCTEFPDVKSSFGCITTVQG